MLLLSNNEFPGTAEELEAALLGSLSRVLALPQGQKVVVVEADRYPDLKRLRIDLSGAVVNVQQRMPKPQLEGGAQRSIRAETMEIEASRVHLEQAVLDVHLGARQVRLDFGRDQHGQAMLVVAGAREGKVDISVSRENLEALLLVGVQAATRKHGITIKQTEVKLSQVGEREVRVELRVRASKFLVSATLWVKGNIQVDEALNLRLSGLSCEGEGKIGQITAGYIQPHLEGLEGRQIPLAAFSLEELSLRELHVVVRDGLCVSAAFGG